MYFASPEFVFWSEIALKMAVTALFVSVATVIAERLGPTVGALVATLPVSAGPVYVFLALDHDTAFISVSAVASRAERGNRDLLNDLCSASAALHDLDQRIIGICRLVCRHFGAQPHPLDRLVGIRSQRSHFRILFLHRRTISPRTHSANEAALVRLSGPVDHGCFTGRRSGDAKLPNWSGGKRRTRGVPRDLHEYHVHPALPSRRSRNRCGIGERHSGPCRIRRSIADASSHSLASRLSNCPRFRHRHLGCVEYRCLCDTAQPGRQ